MRKKKLKIEEVSDEIFNRLEKCFSCFEKQKQDKDDKRYIFFTYKQLKDFFGFTDKEIED